MVGRSDRRPPNLPETVTCQLIDYEQVLRPSWVLTSSTGEHELLLNIVPPTQGLDRKEAASGRWRASPAVKLERLLRETKVQFGLLTNGREFRLIVVPAGLSASHITWDAGTWADEKATLDGFFTLLRQDRFFGPESKHLSKLIAESQEKQLEVTDQLGDQVRAALEDFVRGLDQADRQAAGDLLKGLEPDKLYEMSLIVMMRLVFMLYGEENYLLPHGEVLYDQGYGVTHLYTQLAEQRQHRPESMATTADAWPRLLATFHLIHDGCTHPDLNLIAYGGKLFNPERFPVLEDRRLRVSNAVIYDILRKLCFAKAKLGRETVSQRLSYQSLDIEQIGTVYEGLIDYTVKRAPEDVKAGKTIQEVTFPRLGARDADWLTYEYQVRWSVRDAPTIAVPPQEDRWLSSSDAAVSLAPPFEKRVVEIDADRALFRDRGMATAVVEFASVVSGKPRLTRAATLRVGDAGCQRGPAPGGNLQQDRLRRGHLGGSESRLHDTGAGGPRDDHLPQLAGIPATGARVAPLRSPILRAGSRGCSTGGELGQRGPKTRPRLT